MRNVKLNTSLDLNVSPMCIVCRGPYTGSSNFPRPNGERHTAVSVSGNPPAFRPDLPRRLRQIIKALRSWRQNNSRSKTGELRVVHRGVSTVFSATLIDNYSPTTTKTKRILHFELYGVFLTRVFCQTSEVNRKVFVDRLAVSEKVVSKGLTYAEVSKMCISTVEQQDRCKALNR